MELSDTASLCLAGFAVAVIAVIIFWKPLAALFRLLARSALGAGVLALFAPLGKLLGIHLGVNLVNALVLGVLGLPGFGLLMMLNWLLR